MDEGTYIGRMPFISLAQATVTSLAHGVPRDFLPIFQGAHRPDILAKDNGQAVHQVLRICHPDQHGPAHSANTCRVGVLQLFMETITDD
jgi:hypothetical protein